MRPPFSVTPISKKDKFNEAINVDLCTERETEERYREKDE